MGNFGFKSQDRVTQQFINKVKQSMFNCQDQIQVPFLVHSWFILSHSHLFQLNKHCEILVSCSDKERNCIQAQETVCKLMELHVSSLNFLKVQGSASKKLRELHASLSNCMQAYVTACKLCNCMQAYITACKLM